MFYLSGMRRLALLVLVVILTGCSAGTLGDLAEPTSSSSGATSSSVQTLKTPVSTSAPVVSSAMIPPSTSVVPTSESVVTPPPPPAMPAVAPPVRLQYPEVGIDVPLEGMEVVDGVVDPPTLNGVYYILNRGLPGEGSTGTTYLAGHSWQDADPPFNGLSDTFNGNRGAKVGDVFTLTLEGGGKLSCEVEQVFAISKDELFSNPQHEVWRKVPNRVVLLSCYIAEDDGVTRNVDVIARCGAA